MIKVHEICKTFDGFGDPKVALDQISLEFNRGQWCNLLGPNGSGKSTLLRIISGELQPSEGTVSISGKDVTSKNAAKRARSVFFVEQTAGANLVPTMTVEENALLSLYHSAYPGLGLFRTKQRQSRILECLTQLDMDLDKRLHTQVRFLSGGERQALVLASAMASSAPILLLDEFLAATDPAVGRHLLNVAKDIAHQKALTVLSVTHNVDHVMIGNLSEDRVVMLHKGRVCLDRNVAELPSTDWLIDRYKSTED